MYLDSHDYQTIWNLAHNWANSNADSSDETHLTPEVKIFIQRILVAINGGKISVRNRRFQIFQDDSTITFLLDLGHFRKFNQCLRKDIFNKVYLDSLYVKRAEILAWCETDFLSPPHIWQSKISLPNNPDIYDSSDDENEGWYTDLSERRKQRVACLNLAKKLWLISPSLTYEEIYIHPTMKQYGNPNVFSLEAFKKWARPFAPDQAKIGGRPIKNK